MTDTMGEAGHRAAMMAILDRQKAAHLRDGAPSAEKRMERIDRCIGLLVDNAGDDLPAAGKTAEIGRGRADLRQTLQRNAEDGT